MNRMRHLKLSTFRIEKKGDVENVLSELPRSNTTILMYNRQAKELGQRPRLLRNSTDMRYMDFKRYGFDDEDISMADELRLLDWKKFRWNKTDPDLFQKCKSSLNKPADKSSGTKDEQKGSQSRTARKPRRIHRDLVTLEEEFIPMSKRSLPPLPTNGLGEPMLRRPTITTPRPVAEDGDLFKMITKGRELRPFSFEDDPTKTDDFYDEHFPLLCEKNTTIISRPGSSNAHAAVSLADIDPGRPTTTEKRARQVHIRVSGQDDRLAELEHDSDDDSDVMVTELRDQSFNPTVWSWNKEKYVNLRKFSVANSIG